jgi:hypothetical protein
MITLIVLAVASIVAGVVVVNKVTEHKDDVVETPPFDAEPIVILNPPALPTFPDIVYWDLMDCIQIEQKIDEINQLLMTSKFPQEIYEFWIDQLDKGYIVFATKCIKTEQNVF